MSRTLDPHLYALDPARPEERTALLDEQERLETKLARAQHLVDSDTHTLGSGYSRNLIRRRDLIDRKLSELHGLLTQRDFGAIDRCSTTNCRNFAGEPYRFAGRCEPCFVAAATGTTPDHIDPLTLPEPAINR